MKSWRDIYQYVLGAFVVLAFSVVLVLAFVIKAAQSPILDVLVGAFAGAFITVVQYFFGSSKGSADKNEFLKTNGVK